MNDQQIYQYLARKPGSRAQDIADALDVELREASDALRSLVEVGDVARYAGKAPNGLAAQLYTLSDTFKKSREGVALLAASAQVPVAVAPAPTPPAPAPVAAPALAPVPVPAPAPTPAPAPEKQTGSRAERAIACILEKGAVGDAELRMVMGIKSAEYPSTYLTKAVRAGRVIRDGMVWRPGKGEVVAPVPAKPVKPPVVKAEATVLTPTKVEPAQSVAADVLFAQEVPAPVTPVPPVVAVVAPFKVAPAAQPAAPVFRCGLWSDGVLELQRDGRSLVELTRGEHEQLSDFMRRMLGTVAEKVAA